MADTGATNAIDLFNRVFSKLQRIEQRDLDYGTGERLSRSEIHFIVEVADHPQANMTELAQRLGVTKGAVSQLASRLVERDYLRKLRPVDNAREIILALTDKGRVAHRGHDSYHQRIGQAFFGDLDQSQVEAFVQVMTRIETYADWYLGQ